MHHRNHREALDPFVAAANALGGQAAELGAIVHEAWAAQRDFLLMAAAVRPVFVVATASAWAGQAPNLVGHVFSSMN